MTLVSNRGQEKHIAVGRQVQYLQEKPCNLNRPGLVKHANAPSKAFDAENQGAEHDEQKLCPSHGAPPKPCSIQVKG